MKLIKGQISKLFAFEIIIGGHSKGTFNVEGEGGWGWGGEVGVLKKQTKMNRVRGYQAYLYIHSVKKLPDFSNSKQSSS